MLLSRLSDPAEDFVQAVHCALHRSPCVILYTKQQIKTVAYFHTRTLFRVCHLTHYPTYALHAISTFYLPFLSVGHWWDRQTSLFHYDQSFSDPSVMCSKDRKMDLFRCPVCLFQTGQADGDRPFSRSCLSVPSACPIRWDRQTGHFHCPVCPIML